MATTTRSPNRSSEDAADPTPFLGTSSDESTSGRRLLRRPSLREAARFLRQASGRRLMREPSMVVREAAAEQLEERQSDWAYSKPVVVLDILWNFAFVAAAATVFILSRNENPNMPLRLWIVGYALQCVLHVACVCVEYQRRLRRREQSNAAAIAGGGSGDLGPPSMDGSGHYVSLAQFDDDGISMAKHLESANTMFSFIWWVVGFYWVSADSESLVRDSPLLYWLCIAFLGFDVFFVVFCMALACIVGIAVCCCLPCIIALLYAVADQQEGASKEDIEQLSKFKFQRTETNEKLAGNTQGAAGGIMIECDADSPIEHVLSDEDAVCCTFFAMCWLGLYLPCPGVLYALSVTRYYFNIFSGLAFIVINHSTELCFEHILTLENALCIYLGVIGLLSSFFLAFLLNQILHQKEFDKMVQENER